MLERLNKLVDPRPASSVALTAFRTAIRQQEDFKETAEDIRVRQEQAVASQKQKSREEDIKTKDSGNNSVDLLVDENSIGSSVGQQTEQRGSAVDVKA